jgi:hypothetical protein
MVNKKASTENNSVEAISPKTVLASFIAEIKFGDILPHNAEP